VAWNENPVPAGWASVSTPARNGGVFGLGEDVVFELGSSTSTGYELRDLAGDIVRQGTVTGSTLTVTDLALGWYRLILRRAGQAHPVYGDVNGAHCASVVRPDTRMAGPVPPPSTVGGYGDSAQSPNHALRALGLTGPHRLQLRDLQDLAEGEYNLERVKNDLALLKQWYANSHVDPVRPRLVFCQFRNIFDEQTWQPSPAKLANVTQAVAELYPLGCTHFEGPMNEPGMEDPAGVAAAMHAFHDAVKAGHPDAKVIGPATVTVNGRSVGGMWHGLDAFFAAGGGQWIDEFSFHFYNCCNGDLALARRIMRDVRDLLELHGLQDIGLIQSETGSLAADFGVFKPRQQLREWMLQRFVLEQLGVPKERDQWFYDTQHGYSFASYWVTGSGSTFPFIAATRVMSQELFGKAWTGPLEFGSLDDLVYIGNRFEDPGTGDELLALMSDGTTTGSVLLDVAGANALEVVSVFGEVDQVTVIEGVAAVPVGREPCYVRVPASATASVRERRYGPNLVAWGAFVDGDPALPPRLQQAAADDILQNWYYGNGNNDEPTEYRGESQPTTEDPIALPVRLTTPRPVDTIAVFCPEPYQEQGAFLDFDVDYQTVDGVWHTAANYLEPMRTVRAPVPYEEGHSFYDTYHSGQRKWIVELPEPVTVQAVRAVVRDCTSGGQADGNAAVDYGGSPGHRYVRVQDIRAYCRTAQRRLPVLA
jgi:hypothetical protein